jgi:hypothetical protein
MKIRILTSLAVVALSALAVTACDDTSPASSPKPQAQNGTFTSDIVDQTWDQTSASDREDLCLGIELFTRDQVAELMKEGAGEDTILVDWDEAAELLAAKCS